VGGRGRQGGSKLQAAGQEPGGLLALKYARRPSWCSPSCRTASAVASSTSSRAAAPLSREIAEFFHAADILILEGYGLTESSAASFVNRPDKYKFGTVGLPVPGTQVKLARTARSCIKGAA
jgi:long-chain acyl-CoA synthetase